MRFLRTRAEVTVPTSVTTILGDYPLSVAKHAPGTLDLLPPGYHSLFERAISLFEREDAVRAVWLSGSLAVAERADAASDLDFRVAVRDREFDNWATRWEEWLRAITPTLLARSFSPGSFYCLTPTLERMDVVSERVSELPTTAARERLMVLDKDGLDQIWPREPVAREPNVETVNYLIEEVLRQAANFDSVTVRQDPLLGVVAVQQVHLALYQIFVEVNTEVPVMGPKQWSRKLTRRQREVLERLPTPQPDLKDVRRAQRAALTALVTEGREAVESAGGIWPTALHEAIRLYYAREHNIVIP
jgi:hypothetical protein